MKNVVRTILYCNFNSKTNSDPDREFGNGIQFVATGRNVKSTTCQGPVSRGDTFIHTYQNKVRESAKSTRTCTRHKDLGTFFNLKMGEGKR